MIAVYSFLLLLLTLFIIGFIGFINGSQTNCCFLRQLSQSDICRLAFLDNTLGISVDFKSFFIKLKFGINNIHKVSYFLAFYYDIVSVFSKYFIDKWRRSIDFQLFELVFFLQIEKFFIELIYFIEEFLFNLVFVEDEAELSKRWIIILFTKFIFFSKKI